MQNTDKIKVLFILGLVRWFGTQPKVESCIAGPRLQDAWTKVVILHVTLRCRPYAEDGLW